MPHVVINGHSHEVPAGRTILQALRTLSRPLPTLCHDDRLQPIGACRLCVVDVKNLGRPVPACSTPLLEGMDIATHTPALEEFRRTTLAALARRYPAGAASALPAKEFHRYLREYGIEAEGVGTSEPSCEDRQHPYISVDMSRCVRCYRCVRICDELQGQRVWHVRGRGFETAVVPDGPTLVESSCVSCGACADTCPTGALDDAGAAGQDPPSHWVRTTCPYCGTGCEMLAGTREGRIVTIRPVPDAPVNKGHLCVKGRYAFSFVTANDRITEPMIRRRGRWKTVSWDEALAFSAGRLRRTIRRHGADAVGMLGSARATNEENYLTQKFARSVVGTDNVDCCARVCHAPSAAALKSVLGAGLSTSSFDDIERARTILVVGANPTENHPIIGARIKQAARRGAHLVVIDPRRIELAEFADLHLAPRPGTNVVLLNALAQTIVTERLYDSTFLEQRVSGFDEFARSMAEWTPERAASICGVSADSIRRAARLYATAVPAISFHGLGLTEHAQGTDGVIALVNLALLTGNLGRAGSGVNPLRGQNNVQGASHMGCDPGLLPGSVPLPSRRGLNLLEMLDAAAAGRLKALWAIGYDVLLTNPNASETGRALGALDLVIVQDMFLTETAREFADVFLPACSSFEKEGTFMNAERRIQRVRKALEPAGGSKPDWQILCGLARGMGATGFEFESPEEIWNEVRSRCEGARGMSYARLDAEGGLQWPCPDETHPGTAILHQQSFAFGPTAALRVVEPLDPPEQPSEEYPFILITGRCLYQFNASTMTGRTRNRELRAADVLDVSPEDAARLGVRGGEPVEIASRHGTAVLPAHITSDLASGHLFATFHTSDAFVNAVTGPHRDPATGTPDYKRTAVRIRFADKPDAQRRR